MLSRGISRNILLSPRNNGGIMPIVKEDTRPIPLRQFLFFGVDLSHKDGEGEATGTCPFCTREEKLFVNMDSGQYSCKVCGESGNTYTFMRRLWEESHYNDGEGEELATDRGVKSSTLDSWGLRTSFLSGEWLVPGYDAAGKLNQLYRRIHNRRENRWYLNGPKGVNHQLHGLPLFDRSKRDVYLCEGVWDAMALWELLGQVKKNDDDTFAFTSNPSLSLLADANVIATPSCSVFSEYWGSLFAGKRVFICFDNDHPAKLTKRSGAFEGIKRAAQLMASYSEPPDEIHYLCWTDEVTEDGSHWNLDLKTGYDLRDLLTGHDEVEMIEALGWFLDHLRPIQPKWLEGADGKTGKPIVEALPCSDWKELVDSWSKAMYLHEGLIRGLAIMLASSASVDIGLDQLWVKFIGPPSSGKTTLADGLLFARKYATLKSIISGIHSGYKGKEEDGDQDFSLMGQIKGKAVIFKDGDTLKQAENKVKILADLRDAYDRKTSTFFKNGVARDYEDWSFVLLIFGTSGMRELDQSELGQRLVDCVVMEGIDPDVESAVNDHKKSRVRALMSNQAIANGDRTEGAEKLEAKRKTGGYLNWLRQNIKVLIGDVKVSDETLDLIDVYARMIAYFRARPSSLQTEDHTRELSGRLFDQLSKLGYCLAVVMNKSEIDEEVLSYIRRTALDTARGNTLKVATQLFKSGNLGMDTQGLSMRLNVEPRDMKHLLIFMRGIDIIETHLPTKGSKVGLGSGKMRWRLTPTVRKLYSTVMEQ